MSFAFVIHTYATYMHAYTFTCQYKRKHTYICTDDDTYPYVHIQTYTKQVISWYESTATVYGPTMQHVDCS